MLHESPGTFYTYFSYFNGYILGQLQESINWPPPLPFFFARMEPKTGHKLSDAMYSGPWVAKFWKQVCIWGEQK